jgi:xylulokinase
MLPGDYINMRLTGEINTTVTGLSEGMFWNFKENSLANFLLDYYGVDSDLIPEIVPNFTEQGKVSAEAAKELGIAEGAVIAYRAGDQPNNAFSLNVLNPGEIAATAGTSGVVYGVSDEVKYDPQSRVNTFAHVNHTPELNRLGILLCVNGTGILNSWMKHNVADENIDYPEMNNLAAKAPIGSDGLAILPFGNGAERLLKNQNPGASVKNLNFNIHNKSHVFRAAQEGIVFAFNYGIEIMESIGVNAKVIKAGNANMFLSPIFRETLAGITGATIELYDTDGAIGAAKGAGIGAGIYNSFEEAFSTLRQLQIIEPSSENSESYKDAFENWKSFL